MPIQNYFTAQTAHFVLLYKPRGITPEFFVQINDHVIQRWRWVYKKLAWNVLIR
jgi:hypothetical protein